MDLRKIRTSRNKAGAVVQFYTRLGMWMNLPGKIMIFALFYDRYGLNWWLYVLGVLFLIWLVFDFLFIYPQQADFGFKQSKSMRELQNNIKWIREKIELDQYEISKK